MTDATITCPNCSHDIPLTESLAGPLMARREAEHRRALEAERERAAQAMEARAAEMTREAQAAAARAMAEETARRDADLQARTDRIAALEAEGKVRAEKLAEAQKSQAEAEKLRRELDQKASEMELELQRRLSAEMKAAAAKQAELVEARVAQKVAEGLEQQAQVAAQKDQQIEGMRRQIEALQQRASQGSMQMQGEAAEVVLEDRLAQAFPMDAFEPVGTGQRGADCLQRVGEAGAILWESKRTKAWSKDWLPKLRADQRTAGAEIAVLVSMARPEGVESFALVDGVWVTAPRYAIVLTHVLRHSLLEVAGARAARQGQATKTEMLYDYLTGPQFRSRVEAVVERFEALRDGLEKERKQMRLAWAAREKNIDAALDAMIGMHGDVVGIAGQAVPEISGLEAKALR